MPKAHDSYLPLFIKSTLAFPVVSFIRPLCTSQRSYSSYQLPRDGVIYCRITNYPTLEAETTNIYYLLVFMAQDRGLAIRIPALVKVYASFIFEKIYFLFVFLNRVFF